MTTILETERILLRQFVDSDYPAVYEFNSNSEVQKYTGEEIIQSLDQAKEIITYVQTTDYNVHGYGRWAAIYKPENKIIGFAGLKYLPEVGETDIGYRFLPAYWGQGIATEIAHKIIEYGFEELNLNKIVGIAMPENIGSCKVLEKIGMQFEKIAGYDGDGGAYNWYLITKEAYIEQRG